MEYCCNDRKDTALFRELFGIAWEAAAELDRDLGAFLLLDSEQRVVLDQNAARFLGVRDGEPNYAELKEFLTDLRGMASDFEARFLSTGGQITAGYLRARNNNILQNLHCRLSSHRELSRAAEASVDSVIMMLEIEGLAGSDEEQECCVFSAVDTILRTLPEDALMSPISERTFRICLPACAEDPVSLAEKLAEAVRRCTVTSKIGTLLGEQYELGLSVGICAERLAAAYKMHAASFALYEAKAGRDGGIRLFSPETYESRREEYSSLMKFSRLISENLFVYHFQPIVSAQDGNIVAYEALMRSDPSIGYGPLEILDIAAKRGRLYDIELATMRNTLAALSENQSYFDDRKLFINSIPSEILSEEDFAALKADFGELTEKTVVELTEHTEITDEALDRIKDRIKAAGMRLAIDDYGTGYSNTSNLMRYTPDYLKLDRALIAGIENDPKRQALIAGLIEFAHSFGCMVLAEGVETLDEIRTVINLSVDLLQGYYVSRPKPVLLNEISETVRSEIVEINLAARGNIRKTYRAADGDVLDMQELALKKYTDIFLEGGSVTLRGEPNRSVHLPVAVKENAECEITLHSAWIEPEQDVPALKLSKGSRVCLICEGESAFRNGGIYVPAEAALRIKGSGTMSVYSESTDCFAIGTRLSEAAGDLHVDLDGTLNVFANGVHAVGIGGGHCGSICITAGQTNIAVTGESVVGIGTAAGKADVLIHDCGLSVRAMSVEAVCIGSVKGDVSVTMHNTLVQLTSSGGTLCCVGSPDGGAVLVHCRDMRILTEMKGKRIINIGSADSSTDCEICRTEIDLYSEGSSVLGIGDMTGGGTVLISDSTLKANFLSGDARFVGSPNGTQTLDEVVQQLHLNE